MKMILKNHKNISINIWTKKNYFIFLISLLLVSITTGIIFFSYVNSNDKEILIDNIKSYFTLKDNYNYLNLLFDSIKNNFLTTCLIWILGISIIGVLLILFLYFMEGFSIGFSIAAIISSYKYKGIIGSFLYLFPSKLIYLLLIFLLTFFSIKFSYKLIKGIFTKADVSLKDEIKKYYKILFITLIIALICSLLEVFIAPLMIKLWTFLNN